MAGMILQAQGNLPQAKQKFEQVLALDPRGETLLDRRTLDDERAARPFRKIALSARLVGGGSWRRAVTLREPTAEPDRLRQAIGPKLQEALAESIRQSCPMTGQRLVWQNRPIRVRRSFLRLR